MIPIRWSLLFFVFIAVTFQATGETAVKDTIAYQFYEKIDGPNVYANHFYQKAYKTKAKLGARGFFSINVIPKHHKNQIKAAYIFSGSEIPFAIPNGKTLKLKNISAYNRTNTIRRWLKERSWVSLKMKDNSTIMIEAPNEAKFLTTDLFNPCKTKVVGADRVVAPVIIETKNQAQVLYRTLTGNFHRIENDPSCAFERYLTRPVEIVNPYPGRRPLLILQILDILHRYYSFPN